MIDKYDFDFSPGMTNPYIPAELLEKDAMYDEMREQKAGGSGRRGKLVEDAEEDEEPAWRPFSKGGYLDVDRDEIVEFNDDGEWDLLEDDFDLSPEFLDGDEIWTS